MKKMLLIILFILITACSGRINENNLSNNDIKFIQQLGILDNDEDIEMIESNGGINGVKKSGNFITKKRLASYWIEDRESEINDAFYSDIDSISAVNLVNTLTYASYLKIYKKNGSSFNLYVDADSTRTSNFFNKAKTNWIRYKTNK